MDGNREVPMPDVAPYSGTTFQPNGTFEHGVSVSKSHAEIPRIADELENRCSALEELVQLLQGKLARVTRDPEVAEAPALATPPSITGLGVDLNRSADRLAEVLRQLHDLYDRTEL